MPAPFKQLARDQFAELIMKFDFKRKINAVHMHHTWRPNHSQYDRNDGHRTILGMFVHHTRVNKWQDIARHITIAPDGSIWLGRNWNLPPVSAAGHNGNSQIGPFMFEIIGDFDQNRDRLEGEQLATVLDVIARVQMRFGLAPETLKFHNEMSVKSCPGTAIDRATIVSEVRKLHQDLAQSAQAPRTMRGGPFDQQDLEINDVVEAALDSLGWDAPPATDPADAEPHYDNPDRGTTTPGASRAIARDSGLTAQMLSALRPHLVNLNLGQFSKEGEWKTDRGDVDAIFDQHLEQALQRAKQHGELLRIVFFAHGGLVKESAGLEIAHKHLAWWKDNGIYPIFFIWETGFFETVGQLLRRSQQGTRNFVSDHITDPLIEAAARKLKGPTLWGGMKLSAERASADNASLSGQGGAHYVASKLKAFCDKHDAAKIELHAAGHSAGSIFHAHFLAAARVLKVPSFKTAHLLAPAIRVDLFKKLIADLVGPGKGIDHLSVYTMLKDHERDDTCAVIYRKSLLYLVYHALEPEEETPILGLEQCLRADPQLQSLFGLDSNTSAAGEVIFSITPIDKGKSASTSTTHGGFDDDAPTMNSIARRILGKADADVISEYKRDSSRAFDVWENQVDWPARVQQPTTAPSTRAVAPIVASLGRDGGRKRALCIGINQYAAAPLAGCVADAEEWARTFTQLGFDTRLMRDGEATHADMVSSLSELIDSGAPGDVIAFQFAGHGTQLPDLDGDDEDGTDEAMVPYDYAGGRFLIDDDVRAIFSRIPDGVNVTCFFDCCHSGTNTRFGIGAAFGDRAGVRDRRRRFLPASEDMKKAHEQYRAQAGAKRTLSVGGRESMRNIAFSACLSDQVAWESDGHGDFTARATRLLQTGIDGITNQQLNERIVSAFGADARQRPLLDCASAASGLGLLQPLTVRGSMAAASPATPGIDVRADTIRSLQAVIQRLQSS